MSLFLPLFHFDLHKGVSRKKFDAYRFTGAVKFSLHYATQSSSPYSSFFLLDIFLNSEFTI